MLTGFKWYRKACGGTWHNVEYTYKKDMGMTRVTETKWIKNKELSSFQELHQHNKFKILETESY